MSNFKKASQLKLRFNTEYGSLNVEQLWDLSITKLDSIAVELETLYNESGNKSFIKERTEKSKELKLQFDIVLDVLKTKLTAAEKASAIKETKDHNAKIDALIARKQETEMENMSIEELEALRK